MVVREALDLWDRDEILISLEYLLDKKRFEILLDQDLDLGHEVSQKILTIVEGRKKSYPLQYLIGRWAFYDFDVYVEEGVLIPRPETELLVEEALNSIEEGARVLEIGPGTGIISIALAKHKKCQVTAVDISDQAVALTKKNAAYNGVEIEVIQGNLYEPVDGEFDLIISNPPYIKEAYRDMLDKELSYEPDQALFSGQDGLDLIRLMIKEAPLYLKDKGLVLVEFGYDQGKEVKSLFKEHGFQDIIIKKDYSGHDRIGKGSL